MEKEGIDLIIQIFYVRDKKEWDKFKKRFKWVIKEAYNKEIKRIKRKESWC